MNVGVRRDVPSITISLAVTASVVTLGVLAWHHRAFTVDDAFITLRYASNLAKGHGPTWNPGDAPVEGYTTFLWMLVTTLPHLAGIDALAFAKIAGVLAAVATIGAAGLLAIVLAHGASREARLAAAAIAVVTVGCSTSTAVHAVSGMETTLFTFLLTLFAATLLRWEQHGALLPALVGLAAGLTRPEGNLYVGVAFAAAIAGAAPASRRVLARAALLAWLMPYAIYFAWRLSYYGLLAPLSFYVKATNEPGILRGTDEALGVVHLLFVAQPQLGIALVVGAVACRRRAAPVLLAALAFVLFFLVPAPIMAYERRYLYPLFPTLFAIAGAGVAAVVERRRRLAPVAVACFGVLAAVDVARHARGSIDGFTAYGEGLVRAHVRLAHDLEARADARTRTIALVDVGAVAYVSGWRTIDTFGLNDAHVARSARHDPAYVEAQDPDVVVFLSQRSDRLVPHLAWEQALHDAFVAHGYAPMRAYRFAPDYFLYALERPATPDPPLPTRAPAPPPAGSP